MEQKSQYLSSRYLEYDYDTGCITGFNRDEQDNTLQISPITKEENLHTLKTLDAVVHQQKKQEDMLAQQLQSNYAYNQPQLLPFMPVIAEKIRYFDTDKTDKRLSVCSSDPESNAMDTIVRKDASNNIPYIAYGTGLFCHAAKVTLILHQDSSMRVGLIDANALVNDQKEKKIKKWRFLDTDSHLAKKWLFPSGQSAEGCVVQLERLYNSLICKNISEDWEDYGREIRFSSNMDTTKEYKLMIILDKPSAITLYYD